MKVSAASAALAVNQFRVVVLVIRQAQLPDLTAARGFLDALPQQRRESPLHASRVPDQVEERPARTAGDRGGKARARERGHELRGLRGDGLATGDVGGSPPGSGTFICCVLDVGGPAAWPAGPLRAACHSVPPVEVFRSGLGSDATSSPLSLPKLLPACVRISLASRCAENSGNRITSASSSFTRATGSGRPAACGRLESEHLGEIQQHYRQRPFVRQEVGAGIARALSRTQTLMSRRSSRRRV